MRLRSRVFAVPILVALASAVGLLAALLGDGVWDAVSWAGLGQAVLLCAWYGLRRGRRFALKPGTMR